MATYVTTAGTTNAAWSSWCAGGTASTATPTATNHTWVAWVTRGTTASTIVVHTNHLGAWPRWAEEVQTVPESAEARASREAEDVRAGVEREAAGGRAEALLLQSITPRQREQYRRFGWFTLRGASGAHYRVRKGRTGNVDQLDLAGAVIERYCAHPGELVPDCDTMLAQALMLETDDHAFQRVANRHGAHGPPVPQQEMH